jgi:hypothetical protein
MDLRWSEVSKVKIVAVVVGLAVLVALWTVDVSDTVMVVITVAWVAGLFGWAWITGNQRQRDGYISNVNNSAYSYNWRDSPSIGNPGGYRYADPDYDPDADPDADGGGDSGGDSSGSGGGAAADRS